MDGVESCPCEDNLDMEGFDTLAFVWGVYYSVKETVYDALYFFVFSVVAILLFLMRRKQRRFHEKSNSKK